jgi:hypothetical protein
MVPIPLQLLNELYAVQDEEISEVDLSSDSDCSDCFSTLLSKFKISTEPVNDDLYKLFVNL